MTESENENDHFDLDHFDQHFGEHFDHQQKIVRKNLRMFGIIANFALRVALSRPSL